MMENKLIIEIVNGLEKEYKDIIEYFRIELVEYGEINRNNTVGSGKIGFIVLNFWPVCGKPRIENIKLCANDFTDFGRFKKVLKTLDCIRELITK